MSWQDRDYNRGGGMGKPGGDWQGVRPSFDNPMSWSVPIGRYFGIDVRVHIIMLLYVVIELFRSLGAAEKGEVLTLGAFFTTIQLGGLFLLVLLHEFGHCFACRSTGGEANEILMWPLGGLAYCAPPHRWTAHLWTVAGGPLVNVAFIPVFAIVLGIGTGYFWGVALPIPFVRPGEWWALEDSVWLLGLYLVAQMNMFLLLFNLLPMFPLDGGRFVQSLLWPKFGYVRSMRISLRVGYVGAIALGLFGAVMGSFLLVGIAIFGGISCWMTHKQLQFTEEVMGFEYDPSAAGIADEPARPRKPSKRALKRAKKLKEQARKDEQELDRILKKIAEGGMGSLTSSERRWLQSQSRRKRESG